MIFSLSQFIPLYCLILTSIFAPRAKAFNCYLPETCRLESVDTSVYIYNNTEKENWKDFVIMCTIKNDAFEFKFEEPTKNEKCFMNNKIFSHQYIFFRWTSNELSVLENRFSFTNLIRYISYLKPPVSLRFLSLKGFDVNIYYDNFTDNSSSISIIQLLNCQLDFYHETKRINSCQDFIDLNISRIESIFQIRAKIETFELKHIDYKQKICPFVFSNISINKLILIELVDTFYEKSVLKFNDEIFSDLKSNITYLQLDRVYNVNFDSNLLHRSVFNYTSWISIRTGSLNSINGQVFKNLSNLVIIQIDAIILRKINHKQGINWIGQLNSGINVNLSNISSKFVPRELFLDDSQPKPTIKMSKIFPDEDFCIYSHFPFNQFVIFYEIYYGNIYEIDEEFSCTYLWLVQFYEYYYNYYSNIDTNNNNIQLKNIQRVLNSTDFKSISKCNFEEKISSCNRSNYKPEDIWDESDFFILNKKLQIAFKILLYPTDFFAIITNLIVVIVLVKKENNDLFKEYKQYSYLYLNSIFCVLISLIELLSWITECFYPFEVFCPEIRKLVAIQLFKIIFKECLVTTFRFMCSFTYIAFALNRISLIGNDHGKLITFMSKLGIKKYIGITILISISLSWIKYFTYEINYFYPEKSYPMSNEMDIILSHSNRFKDFYYIFNSISDIVNYLVFVIICAVIDITMVVELRRVLVEKTKKSELKKAENETAVNKAIKMVVLNSVIGIFFKLPVSFIPLLNVYAEYYYKDRTYQYSHPSFALFYSRIFENGFFSLVQDVSNFLFTLSLSIQIFIYYQFDKKFQKGLIRLIDNIVSYIKSIILNKSNVNLTKI